MQKVATLHTRIDERHLARINELVNLTGLNTSQIVRMLIERAKVELAPMPVPVIAVKECCPDAGTSGQPFSEFRAEE